MLIVLLKEIVHEFPNLNLGCFDGTLGLKASNETQEDIIRKSRKTIEKSDRTREKRRANIGQTFTDWGELRKEAGCKTN